MIVHKMMVRLHMFVKSGWNLIFCICLLFSTLGCAPTCCPSADLIDVPEDAIDEAVSQASEDSLFEMTEWIPEDWWNLFEDEQLASFIEQALDKNPTIQTAHTQILAAESNAKRVRAALFPTLFWDGDVTRTKVSETSVIQELGKQFTSNLPIPPAGGPLFPVYFTEYETYLNFTYDFDLWGKNRNDWKAALDLVHSKIADEAFARLALSISVASVYLQLQIDYQRADTLSKIVSNREKFSELTNQRVFHNISNNPVFNKHQ